MVLQIDNTRCRGNSSHSNFLCNLDDPYLLIYYIIIVVCMIVSLFSFFLLIYKRFHDNSPIWSNHVFEPITGLLLWLTLHSSLRAVHLTITALDLMNDAMILESFINFAGWAFGQFAIATYIVGIFKAIPKLTFHRPTTNRLDKKCKPTQFIPAYQSILFIYWSFIITIGVIISVLACLRGYYIQIQNRQMARISQECLLIILSIANVICILCLLKYGRLLIVLTKESVSLVGGGNDDSLFYRQTYKAYLKKLKIINFALTVIVGWSSVTFLSWAIASIIKRSTLLTILSCISNICSVIMMMAAIFGVIRGELYPKYVSDTVDVISITTISSARLSQASLEIDSINENIINV